MCFEIVLALLIAICVVKVKNMTAGEQWLRSPEKRSFDIAFSSLAIPFSIPIGMAALAVVMLENRHAPFFFQERIGNPDEVLLLPKVRTLSGPVEYTASDTGHNHVRATGKVSKLVRKSHIDELPQLGLVTTGHMSVVGPRPIVRSEFENVMDSLSSVEQTEWLHARRMSKPGLVNSLSLDQHIPEYENTAQDVAAADIAYAHEASSQVDRRIILQTARTVLADLVARPRGDSLTKAR